MMDASISVEVAGDSNLLSVTWKTETTGKLSGSRNWNQMIWDSDWYGNITDEDYEELKKGINKASEAVASIIKDGIDMAMNKYNK